MEAKWSLRLIRLAAIFGLLGAILGSHMAGSGSYQFRPIHAHILVVGWLSVFAWGMFYRVYKIKSSKLVATHGWTAVIGSIGLTAGMWLNAIQPFNVNETFALLFYIVGGVILLISFGLFIITTFMIDNKEDK
ncbi:hypothetical protein [Domibacillus mangrovi]|uniref:Cytochrome-c oxidase n=1 Tax=Domibacillus mangrovi TaxID=1714354 RepID=A0A1Q5P6G5_9BACI|nr:hypothetical protein [Domibacillus mangrovi]OKL37846.1 hypothetical protein BLL40_03205 [Domibacillus mangrovi]